MDLTSLPFTGIGWGSVVVFVVILIFRGDLVTRKMHQEIVDDRDNWRAVAEQAMSQNAQLIAAGRLSVNAVASVARQARQVEPVMREEPL